jgi:RNA polymerase sigma factor (sigma-70 family)
VTGPGRVEDLLRALAPEVLAAVRRRFGGEQDCEDAVQEALFAAWAHWPVDGLPDHPKGWLITTAARRRVEISRNQAARGRREAVFAGQVAPDAEPDDTLALLLLCCHPALTTTSQVTLTLRIVGGLTTPEIARALLVPEPTVAQRISRAKQRIRDSALGFRLPGPGELPDRLTAVLHVLYLMFNEGHTASSGPGLVRELLITEAIRVTRQLRGRLPLGGEVTGLLALMLLTDARRPARTLPDGRLVPLADQDRARWDHDMITEGTALVTGALAVAEPGPFQLQAAIAAVHDEADTAADTDWTQILGLYTLLRSLAPGPMVTLNRIVALAMAHGPAAALVELAEAAADPALAEHHRLAAVRAHLLELTGEWAAAREQYRVAARLTLNLPERDYLLGRADACR